MNGRMRFRFLSLPKGRFGQSQFFPLSHTRCSSACATGERFVHAARGGAERGGAHVQVTRSGVSRALAPGWSAESGDRIASGRVSPGRAGRSKSRKAASRSERQEYAKKPRAMQQGNGAGGAKQVGMTSNDAGGNTRWKTWQTDADIPSRKILIQHMYVPQSRRYRTRINPKRCPLAPPCSFSASRFRALRDRPGCRRTAIAERMLTQNLPEFAQLAAVSAEEAHRDEGVATEAPRLRAALGRGRVPRRPLQGARRSFPFRATVFSR